MQVGHAESFSFGLDHALIENVRLGELVFEESFVVVPRIFCGTVGQARKIFLIFDGLGVFAAALGYRGEQSEVETLDGLAAFVGEFGADAAFVFEAGDFVAPGAAEVTNPFLAFSLERGIIHERSIWIR